MIVAEIGVLIIGRIDVREIHRKPLLVNDVMYHAVRLFPGLQAPGRFRKLLRGFLKLKVTVFTAALSLHPRSGGFTLLATGVR